MNTLKKYLEKIGVKRYEDLNEEEKATMKEWEKALSGREITQDDYRKFLEMELNNAILRMTEVDLSVQADIFRKVEVRIIKKILTFLDMPKYEKEMLEKQLETWH